VKVNEHYLWDYFNNVLKTWMKEWSRGKWRTRVSDKPFHDTTTEKANFQNQAVSLPAWVWLNW